MQKDAQAILDTDPAADCIQEIINSYPGFFAIESIALPILHLEQLSATANTYRT
jgi:serine acetyltransferase